MSGSPRSCAVHPIGYLDPSRLVPSCPPRRFLQSLLLLLLFMHDLSFLITSPWLPHPAPPGDPASFWSVPASRCWGYQQSCIYFSLTDLVLSSMMILFFFRLCFLKIYHLFLPSRFGSWILRLVSSVLELLHFACHFFMFLLLKTFPPHFFNPH